MAKASKGSSAKSPAKTLGNEVNESFEGFMRQAIGYELDRLCENQRLTPAQRRIAQCLVEHSSEIGYLSSMDVGKLANVSQPSVTRFAMALGFDGYMDLRKYLGAKIKDAETPPIREGNRYQVAALNESRKLTELSDSLADRAQIDRIGKLLAQSQPLPVLGLRASSGLVTQFSYFAAKVHPNVMVLNHGGSLLVDRVEQACRAGATAILAFMMPLYPREAVDALECAKELGLSVILVTDAKYSRYTYHADETLHVPINSNLVFDSYACSSVLVSVLLDTLATQRGPAAQRDLEAGDKSTKSRKAFVS